MKRISPWCAMLTPQPDSAGFHQRSWKFGDEPGARPASQNGGDEKSCRPSSLLNAKPSTVAVILMAFTLDTDTAIVPTGVRVTWAGSNVGALNAGPVVR